MSGVPRVAMLASRLHTSSSHDVTTSTAQMRLSAAAAASSTRRHSVLVTKKDVGLVKDCKLEFVHEVVDDRLW